MAGPALHECPKVGGGAVHIFFHKKYFYKMALAAILYMRPNISSYILNNYYEISGPTGRYPAYATDAENPSTSH